MEIRETLASKLEGKKEESDSTKKASKLHYIKGKTVATEDKEIYHW